MNEELLLQSISPPSSPEQLQYYIDLLRSLDLFSKEPDSLIFFLNGLIKFQNEKSKEYSIGVIRNWVSNRWNLIPAEIYPLLIDVCFNQILIFQDDKFILPLSSLQVMIVINLYPHTWINCWDTIISFPDMFLVHFLRNLSCVEDNIDFLNITFENGIQERILNEILQKLVENKFEYLNALLESAKWLDVSYLAQNDIVSYMYQLLSDQKYSQISLKIFTIILSKQEDLAINLLSSHNFLQVFSTFNLENVLFQREIAEFLTLVILPIIHNIISSDYVYLSIDLYSSLDPVVTINLQQFISQTIKAYPETHEQLLQILLVKISQSIENKTNDSETVIENSINMLSHLARASQTNLSDVFINLLKNISKPDLLSIATFLRALSEFFQDNPNENLLVEQIISSFCFLVDESHELTYSYIVSLSAFSKIIYGNLYLTSDDFKRNLFHSCARAIIAEEDIDSESRTNIEDTLLILTEDYPEIISQTNDLLEIITSFIDKLDQILITISSKIIALLDDNSRIIMYSHYLEVFNVNFDDIPRSLVLKFLESMNIENCDIIHPTIIDFIYKTKEIIGESMKDFPLFLKSTLHLIGIDAYKILFDMLSNLCTNEIMDIVGQSYIYFYPNDDSKEILKLITQYILNNLPKIIEKCDSDNMFLDEVDGYKYALSSLLEFFINTFEMQCKENQYLCLSAIVNTINTGELSQDEFIDTIKFITPLINQSTIEIFKDLDSLLLKCCLMLHKNAQRKKHTYILSMITQVFHQIYLINPDIIINSMQQVFSNFVESAQLHEEYIKNMNNECVDLYNLVNSIRHSHLI